MSFRAVVGLLVRAKENTIDLILSGPIERGDIPRLCQRLRELLERGPLDAVVCDVSSLVSPDAAAVDALARLQLTAHRLGSRLCLRGACGELKELLALMGLDEAIPLG